MYAVTIDAFDRYLTEKRALQPTGDRYTYMPAAQMPTSRGPKQQASYALMS